jgi:Zn ribbon nucleic-acid-binding protein
MRSGDEDKLNICGTHGKDPYWVKTKIAKGEICVECVAAGYYRKDIEEEIKANYPDAYASAKAGTFGQFKDNAQEKSPSSKV